MAERDKKTGRFVKGQTGNPNGRPISSAVFNDADGNPLSLEDIMALNGHLVVQQHVKLILDKATTPSARMTAISEFYKRWLGPPPEVVAKPTTDDPDIDVSGMDAEALLKLVHSNEGKK